MTVEDFAKELQENLSIFVDNMKHQEAEECSFPEWYNMFGRWLEVGTDMEKDYWD